MKGLWNFALTAWRKPSVEAICLQLQDDYQVSVALLLCGCWLGVKRQPVYAPLAKTLAVRAEKWESQRLQPLRELRRVAGQEPQWAEWKRLLQDAELEGERLLLNELEALVSALPRAPDTETSQDWLPLLVMNAATCEGQAHLIRRLWCAVCESVPTKERR